MASYRSILGLFASFRIMTVGVPILLAAAASVAAVAVVVGFSLMM